MEKTRDMPSTHEDKSHFVKNSVLYREFLAEREEILKHKWIESEKAGRDVGFNFALIDWLMKYGSKSRRQNNSLTSGENRN